MLRVASSRFYQPVLRTLLAITSYKMSEMLGKQLIVQQIAACWTREDRLGTRVMG